MAVIGDEEDRRPMLAGAPGGHPEEPAGAEVAASPTRPHRRTLPSLPRAALAGVALAAMLTAAVALGAGVRALASKRGSDGWQRHLPGTAARAWDVQLKAEKDMPEPVCVRLSGVRLADPQTGAITKIMGEKEMPSADHCAEQCSKKKGCLQAVFSAPNNGCFMFDRATSKLADKVPEDGDFYESMYCNLNMAAEESSQTTTTMLAKASKDELQAGLLKPHEYSLIFDAGSSSTRLRMYNQTSIEEIKPKDSDEDCFRGKALSVFTDDPCASVDEIQRMLKCAEPYVTEEEQQSLTPVWLRATAGVRLATPDDADHIMSCLNEEMRKPGATVFMWMDAELASGTMEAKYGSIMVNHYYGKGKDYVGSLGLGGASAQIAFRPSRPILNSQAVMYNSSLQPISIYAKSYIRYGQDLGLRRSYDLLIASAEKRGELLSAERPPSISHPCLLKGHTEDYTAFGRTFRFVGEGESSLCALVVEKLMNLDYECMMPPCAINGVYQTALHGKFYAYSAYFYLAKALGLMQGDETVITPREIADTLPGFCNISATQLKKERPDGYKYDNQACFNGWFALAMLKAMYFRDDDTSITFAKGGDWTVGALLYLTKLSPASACTMRLAKSAVDSIVEPL